MRLRTFVSGKIHGLRITQCKLHYNGSCEIDPELLRIAGMEPYEQVHVLNMASGARLITYVFPGAPGAFTLNGAAARCGMEGDTVLVIAYRQEERFSGARCVLIDPATNRPREILDYPAQSSS